jgi:hypothetical protein
MKKNQCINCAQMLKPAPADSEYTWIGKTDGNKPGTQVQPLI